MCHPERNGTKWSGVEGSLGFTRITKGSFDSAALRSLRGDSVEPG